MKPLRIRFPRYPQFTAIGAALDHADANSADLLARLGMTALVGRRIAGVDAFDTEFAIRLDGGAELSIAAVPPYPLPLLLSRSEVRGVRSQTLGAQVLTQVCTKSGAPVGADAESFLWDRTPLAQRTVATRLARVLAYPSGLYLYGSEPAVLLRFERALDLDSRAPVLFWGEDF